MNRNRPYGRFKAPEHYEVARTVAEEGIVLMKNENHFFPIQRVDMGKLRSLVKMQLNDYPKEEAKATYRNISFTRYS